MEAPWGQSTGIPVITEESRGTTAPQAAPYRQPQRKPQSSTGMCIGRNTPPKLGTAPTKGTRWNTW